MAAKATTGDGVVGLVWDEARYLAMAMQISCLLVKLTPVLAIAGKVFSSLFKDSKSRAINRW